MEIKIRNAKPEDVKDIQEVFYRTWLATYQSKEHGITEDDIKDRFKDSLAPERLEKRAAAIKNLPDNEKFLVAVDGEKVIGLARLIIHSAKNQLQAIYVLPEYQGKGVGRLLWERVKASFDASKPITVEVATYNAKAIAFYKKIGFKETGRIFTDERFKMKSGNMIPEMELIC